MSTWFSADHHFGHKNIIRFCNRPFASVEEMDSVLIDNWNSVVGPDDTVWYLGDFSLSGDAGRIQQLWGRLNGHVRCLTYPFHHDRRWQGKRYWSASGEIEFEGQMVSLSIDRRYLHLCHFPLEIWDRKHYGAWHLHGHSHGKAPKMPGRLDVGVDCWNYYPVSWEQVCYERGER